MLPVRLGGMGITNPVSTSHRNFEASTRLTSPLVATIATQDQGRLVDMEAKASIRRSNRENQAQQAESVHGHLSPQLKRHVDLAMEKGASSWLSVLPLDDHNFSLHKGALFVCDMAGSCRIPQLNAAAAQPSQLIMPLSAPRGASLQFYITSYAT